MKRLFRFRVVVVPVLLVLAVAACAAPPDAPTAEAGAAELGLVPGTTLNYDAGPGLTEAHALRDSGFLFSGGLAVDVLATQNGFARDERTLTFGIDVAQVSLVRFFDCLRRCGQPDRPIAFLNWPLADGEVVEGSATVTETTDGVSVLHIETHRTTVGAAVAVTVGAGTFEAFPIVWQRIIERPDGSENSESAALWIAPGTGIVKHETFDGTTLALTAVPGA
jgi:hypothetical protein